MSLEFWLSRLDQRTASDYRYTMKGWLKWLEKRGEPSNPDVLVSTQKGLRGDEAYRFLTLIQMYVNEKENLSASRKRNTYFTLRSFFLHNRAPLPRDASYKIRSSKQRVLIRLTIEDFKRILHSCDVMYRAIFLSMFQASLGVAEFLHWNRHGWSELEAQLRRNTNPIKISLPGRKRMKNVKPYYTYIGRDAVDAMKKWLNIRPESEYIFTSQTGSGFTYGGIQSYWMNKLVRLGLVQRARFTRDHGTRYGYNMHGLRSLFRTRWQKSGRAPEVAEFFMGHTVDPLGYNKAMQDEAYTRLEYTQAEDWLNIMTVEPEKMSRDEVFMRERQMRLELDELKKDMERISRVLSQEPK